MITKKKYNGKVTEHAKIVESYREKDKSTRKRTVLNLGTIRSETDRQRFQEIAKSMNKGKILVDLNEIEASSSKQYGITYTTNRLLEKYGIGEILQSELSDNKTTFEVYEIIKALIINRLVRPSSELSALEWIDEEYTQNLNIKGHQIYRSLDYLIQKKDIIERKIFDAVQKKLNLDLSKSHYDLTSTYFEGKCCDIAFYGYSRDNRKDRAQVVVGLVMIDGIPVLHEVYEGNTVDKITLESTRKKLREKLGIKNITIIADSGLITEANLQGLENTNQEYILGVPRRSNKMAEKYLTMNIDSKDNLSATHIETEVVQRDNKEYSRKYVLCLDKNTKQERLKTLEEIKIQKENELKKLQEKYQKSQENKNRKGKKMTKESIINQAYQILGKNKRLFRIEEEEGKLNVFFNKETYDYEENIAGKFLLVTNTKKGADEIMKSYKELQTVENAFDECKNFLYIRPIFHYKPHRVKAHIFVCMLAFLIESIIEKFSKESARVTLRELERIKLVKLNSRNHHKELITTLSGRVKGIFHELKIQEPIIF